MFNNDEDDWESAELSLKTLDIDNLSNKTTNKPPIVLTSNKYSSDNSFNTTYMQQQAIPVVLSNVAPTNYNYNYNNNAITYGQLISAPSTADQPIDSALLNAMANPRERMILFQIENNILKFVQSNERSMEVSPGYNSFRRLLAYRVGQRFGLSHATTADQCITLFKHPVSTCIPKILLIDLPADYVSQMTGEDNEYDDGQNYSTSMIDTRNNNSSNSLDSSSSNNNNNQTIPAPRKMQLMKRNPNRNNSTNGKASSKTQSQQSSEDREKAYQEARARIFGESSNESNTNTVDTTQADILLEVPPVVTNIVPASLKNNLPSSEQRIQVSNTKTNINKAINQNYNDSFPSNNNIKVADTANNTSTTSNYTNNNTYTIATTVVVENTIQETLSSSVNEGVGSGVSSSLPSPQRPTNRKVDAGSWKENKSQVRNVDMERSDPEFSRRSSSLLASAASILSVNNNSVPMEGAGYLHQQQQQQQQNVQSFIYSQTGNNHSDPMFIHQQIMYQQNNFSPYTTTYVPQQQPHQPGITYSGYTTQPALSPTMSNPYYPANHTGVPHQPYMMSLPQQSHVMSLPQQSHVLPMHLNPYYNNATTNHDQQNTGGMYSNLPPAPHLLHTPIPTIVQQDQNYFHIHQNNNNNNNNNNNGGILDNSSQHMRNSQGTSILNANDFPPLG